MEHSQPCMYLVQLVDCTAPKPASKSAGTSSGWMHAQADVEHPLAQGVDAMA
jgi:hypothetical protein